MMLTISAVCASAVSLSFYAQAKPVELFLLGAAGGFAILITIHTWSVKVWTINGFLYKKTMLGCRTVEMASINEISVMSLRGRYVFMVLTVDKFLMLSTMLENFPVLKDIMKNHMQELAFTEMDKIDDNQITRKKTTMKFMLAALLIICVFIVIYRFKWILI